MTPLADALRRLALHQDIPECAQAADEIERLRGLVAEAHRGGARCTSASFASSTGLALGFGWECSCRPLSVVGNFGTSSEADAAHAAHVRQILDGGGA